MEIICFCKGASDLSMWTYVDVRYVKIVYLELSMCFFFYIFLSTRFK